jgi:hypothetical protein
MVTVPADETRGVRWAALVLVLAALSAYHNSFGGPFIFDDDSSIKDNPTIKS